MTFARRLLLVSIAPTLIAWSGGGSGSGVWQDGAGATRSVELSGLVETGARIRVVVNGTLPDGEGLIDIELPAPHADRRVSALDEQVAVGYREYADDGGLTFAAERPREGWLEVSVGPTHVTVALDAAWYDPRTGAHRRWSGVVVRAGERPSAGAGAGGHGSASAGCDATIAPESDPHYDDDYAEGSGCEGDDWSSDDSSGWDDDSGGGCEGDDLGGSDGYDDSGGCEGDDLGGGDAASGGGASCEGDAIASTGRPRRSPTIVRLINQLPWLLVVIGLRLGRRRRPGRPFRASRPRDTTPPSPAGDG